MKRLKNIGLFVGFCVLALLVSQARSDVIPNLIITSQINNNGKLQLIAAAQCTGSGAPVACCTGSGTGCAAGTYFTLYTAYTNGSKCQGISVSNDDPSATHVVTLEIVNGSNNTTHVASLTTASPTSGTYNTAAFLTPSVWAGLPLDTDTNNYLQLVSGDIVKAAFATAITSGDEIDLFASCVDTRGNS